MFVSDVSSASGGGKTRLGKCPLAGLRRGLVTPLITCRSDRWLRTGRAAVAALFAVRVVIRLDVQSPFGGGDDDEAVSATESRVEEQAIPVTEPPRN